MGRTPEVFPAPTPEYLRLTPAKRRFTRAVASVRAKGVSIAQNKKKCCRSCISHELAEKGAPYAFTYGSQGCGYVWIEDRPVWAAERTKPVDYLYWNFGDYATATILVEELQKEGFTVQWDGSESQCVMVDFRDAGAAQ